MVYTHNQEPVQDNETHKVIWDFEIQTDHLISARRPDIGIDKKKREPTELCTLPGRPQNNIKRKRKEK